MNAEEILDLINPGDKGALAQIVRTDLRKGVSNLFGPNIFGMTIYDGYVTEVIFQIEDENTWPFSVVSDNFEVVNEYGKCHHTIKIQRKQPK